VIALNTDRKINAVVRVAKGQFVKTQIDDSESSCHPRADIPNRQRWARSRSSRPTSRRTIGGPATLAPSQPTCSKIRFDFNVAKSFRSAASNFSKDLPQTLDRLHQVRLTKPKVVETSQARRCLAGQYDKRVNRPAAPWPDQQWIDIDFLDRSLGARNQTLQGVSNAKRFFQ
jgi:hypothetical protein